VIKGRRETSCRFLRVPSCRPYPAAFIPEAISKIGIKASAHARFGQRLLLTGAVLGIDRKLPRASIRRALSWNVSDEPPLD
jgi:hypothetical protein